jgi:gamma-glutamyltranspeptidase/glutathione hydrolase
MAGEIYSNPRMARTLRLIAETRGKAFYEGELAEKIEAFAIEHGAAMRVSDLAAHEADWCGTIHKGFDDVTLHEIPPNGQGIAGLMALGILDHTPIRDLDADDPRALHLQIEAMKLALRDTEAYVADIDHMTAVTPEAMLDPGYLAERAGLIDLARATDFKTGKPPTRGTVYLSAADASGMMVSFIQSNYAGFGSGVVVPGTGIHLQNRGADFSLDTRSQNVVAPGKRPFHTIIPAFLMKGDKPLMSFGVMGGPMQAQGHLQMTLRTQLWGQDVQAAVDAPRWRVKGGLELSCETAFPEATLQSLSDMGHAVDRDAPDNAFGFGGAQLIANMENGAYAAGSDPRKDGQAVGF